jgi:hypothetical protein
MFTSLLSFLGRIWEAQIAVLQTIWNWLKYGYAWLVAVVFGFLAITDTVVRFVWDQVTYLATTGYAFVGGAGQFMGDGIQSNFGSLLEVANVFFPVAEFFTLLSALSVVWVGGITYRFIKSWIPTVS